MTSQTWTNASPSAGDRRRAGDADRPVAARAEEAQLAGGLGDLGVAAVLGTGVDAPRDEPEERAGDAEQAAGQDQRGEAGRPRCGPGVVLRPDAVGGGRTQQNTAMQRKMRLRPSCQLASRAAVDALRSVRSVLNGCVVVAYGA